MKTHVKLGWMAKDRTTLFKGVVEAITYPIHDAIKVTIQPQTGKDGKMQDGYTIDAIGVELQGTKPILEVTEPKPKYLLGSECECAVTGLKGMLVAYTTHMNGCVSYLLQGKIPAGVKAEDFRPARLPEGALKLIKTPKEEKAPTKTGGPKELSLKKKKDW